MNYVNPILIVRPYFTCYTFLAKDQQIQSFWRFYQELRLAATLQLEMDKTGEEAKFQ
jgi:hypothetical protein